MKKSANDLLIFESVNHAMFYENSTKALFVDILIFDQ